MLEDYTTNELRDELEARELNGALRKAKRVEAALTTAKAVVGCLENLPDGSISDHQLEQAAPLLYELAYQCLPGGAERKDGKPSSGMERGWEDAGGYPHTTLNLLTDGEHEQRKYQ